jgi:hypothetical protein
MLLSLTVRIHSSTVILSEMHAGPCTSLVQLLATIGSAYMPRALK